MARSPNAVAKPGQTHQECTKCGRLLPLSEFYMRETRKGRRYLRRDCKSCVKQRSREWGVDYRTQPGRLDQVWERRILRMFGLTPEDVLAMLKRQHFRCLLCQGIGYKDERYKWPVVDHDHATGDIRGLLCNFCNRQLGWVEAVGIERIVAYLAGTLSPSPPLEGSRPFIVRSSLDCTDSSSPTES